MPTTIDSAPKAGDVLGGKYVLREQIGAGGMGIVFLAEQPALARTVAIKILHPQLAANRQLAHRFREEVIAACRVRHPSSVAVIDCDQLDDGTPYIVMEHVPGRPLSRVIAEQEIPVRRALDIVGQILSALGVAHDSGVIHADVKSDNFLVDELEGRDHVTMIDFGLARLDGDERPDDREGGLVSGTPEYLAPEVIRGAMPTEASDLYGVGVILYELLTGTTPFGGGTATEIMIRHVDDVVIPPSLRQPDRDIPEALDRIVLRALDKRPAARFADARELARALDGAARERTAPSRRRRFEMDASAPSDSPTRNCTLPQQRFAHGSNCSNVSLADELGASRRAIGEALMRGRVHDIADSYVTLASTLARGHRFAAAAAELEEGIDILTAGRGPSGPDVPTSVDRLVDALAALYEQAGHRHRARRIPAALTNKVSDHG